MLVIGLTGPTGSGKGCVAKLFAQHGLSVIDADQVYHELLIPPSACLDALVAQFGERILFPDGSLNRRVLGDIVFSDSTSLSELNRIAHSYVIEEIRRQLACMRKAKIPAAVIDAPQLFEAGLGYDCDVIVSVLADADIRLARIMARDNIDRAAALRRMNAQKTDAFFRSHSSYIVENNGSADLLLAPVREILTKTGVLPQ